MSKDNLENMLELPISVQQLIASNNFLESMKMIRQIVFVFMVWVSVILVAVGWYLWEYSHEEITVYEEIISEDIYQDTGDYANDVEQNMNIER